MDYSPPGSSVHGILLARILEWVAISFSQLQAWSKSGPFTEPVLLSTNNKALGIFQTKGSNPSLLHWQADSLPLSHQRNPIWIFHESPSTLLPHTFCADAPWVCTITQSTLVTPWTVASQAPLSLEFFGQGYWSGSPFPLPGGSSPPRDGTWISCISCIAGRCFTTVLPC